MAMRQSMLALGALSLMLTAQAPARDRDPDDGSRTQERLDRDAARAAERAEELADRFTEDRDRIEERTDEDRSDGDEDFARREAEAQEEAAEEAAEREEELAEQREEEAEEAAELANRDDDDDDEDDRGGSGNSALIRDLGDSERAEHDEDGFPVRRGEVVGIDLGAATVRTAEARGFRVIERQRLPSVARELVRLQAPHGMSALQARQRIREIEPRAVVDLVHYYGLSFAAGAKPQPVKSGRQPARSGGPFVAGVIDTAVVPHQALGAARIIPWKDGDFPGAPAEHGTAVASIIAGHGRATIYSANIFRGPAGRPFTSADVIASALEWMLGKDIPTINMSLAGPRNAILDRLVRDAIARGRTVVAAVGNGGPTAPPAYPAALPGVIAVTAVDKDMRVYRYANRGKYISVSAPGVGVVAAYTRGGMASFTGTSFAAPHITGWVARCRADGEGSAKCNARLRKAARDLGTAGFDETYGFGYIN